MKNHISIRALKFSFFVLIGFFVIIIIAIVGIFSQRIAENIKDNISDEIKEQIKNRIKEATKIKCND